VSKVINNYNLVLTEAGHEALMTEILVHLEQGPVVGGGVGGKSTWRPASVRLWAALRPDDAPWATHSGASVDLVPYVSFNQAIHGLLELELIQVKRETGGKQSFFRIELAD